MSLQRWTDEDTFALIEWAADESIAAIKAKQYADAEILHRGIATIIGMGQMLITNDSRLKKWLDLKLSIISYPLGDKSSLCSIVERNNIVNSLDLLTKFFERMPDMITIGEEIVLPEPFDEKSIFW
jgi:hypothetical protein